VELPPYFPTRGHLLLCTGPRCSRVGSQRLFREASDQLERRRLAYYKEGGTVRLSEAGCLGACGHGPTLACYRGSVQLEQAWYCAADLPLVLRIAEAIQNETPLPDDRRYDL
jgi:(2Fe-2S) ferredoxin